MIVIVPSKKIGNHITVMDTVSTSGILLKYYKLFLLLRINLAYTSQITTTITVIGSRPNRCNVLPFKQLFVSFLNQLMSTSYHRQTIVMIKVIHHSRTKQPSHSPMILRPSLNIFWVRPHQISKGSLSWNFL